MRGFGADFMAFAPMLKVMSRHHDNQVLAPVFERPDLHGRTHVFADREQAGEVLAEMLAGRLPETALVMGIPSGGMPVAVACARRLGLPLEVAVVSKVLLPWTTEADAVYCANVREGGRFAVAEAYVTWRDVSEDEAVALYRAQQAE